MTNEQVLILLTALLAVSEGLSLIPAVKANGIFQLLHNILKWFVEILQKKDTPNL